MLEVSGVESEVVSMGVGGSCVDGSSVLRVGMEVFSSSSTNGGGDGEGVRLFLGDDMGMGLCVKMGIGGGGPGKTMSRMTGGFGGVNTTNGWR